MIAQADMQNVVKLSSGELGARVVRGETPQFPPEITAAWVVSTAQKLIVEVVVDKRGKVTQANAISGVSLLRPFAVEAAKQWEFKPLTGTGNTAFTGTIIFSTPSEIYGINLEDVVFYRNLATQSPNSWIAQCLLARSLLEKGYYREAIETYDRAILLKPDAAIAFYGLGKSYCPSLKLCDRNKALESYRKATQLKPDFIEAWIGLARMHDSPASLQDAVQIWKQILTQFPDLGTRGVVYQNLASLYTRMKKLDEKIEAIKGLVQVKQEELAIKPDGQAKFGLAAELVSLAGRYQDRGNYEDAILSYQKAIEFAPETQVGWEARFSMADAYKKKGDQSGAMAVYQEMLAGVEKNAFSAGSSNEQQGKGYYTRGLIYEGMNRLDDALKAYQNALKKSPNWLQPHVELYYVYRKMGNPTAAEKELAIIKKRDEELSRSLREGQIIKIK